MKNLLTVLTYSTVLGFSSAALAAPILVPNSTFSSNEIVTNANNASAVNDFTSSNPTMNYFGVQNYSGYGDAAFANGGADGTGPAAPTTFTTGSLTTIAPLTKYTLSLQVGFDASNTSTNNNGGVGGFNLPTDVTLTLLANGGSTGGATNVSAALIESDATTDLGGGIHLATYTYTFTTGASGGYVGDSLAAQIGANVTAGPGSVNSQTLFDNVSVDEVSTVPESSTWALMGLGAVALFWRMRRRGSVA